MLNLIGGKIGATSRTGGALLAPDEGTQASALKRSEIPQGKFAHFLAS